MATVTVDDPERVVTKEVDQSGRIYLGKHLSGENVEVVVTIKEDDETDDEPAQEATTA
jgi:hypothetical protein